MTIAAIIIAAGTTLAWIALRHCPLARAIGAQIDQVAAASR